MTAEPAIVRDARAFDAPDDADSLQRRALVAAAVGIVGCVLGAILGWPQFLRAYLVGWVFWLGIALGCLAISMIHHLSRGAWGVVVRRVMEAAARTLPLLAVLSIPLLLGLDQLYEWVHPHAGDTAIEDKAAYLNVPFFLVRFVLYFALWYGLALVLSRLSRRQDETGDPALARRMQLIAAPGLAVYCLAATFASVDWLMSLQPHWYSTIYGVYFMGGQALSALAFVIMAGYLLSRRAPMDRVLAPRHFHDWGKLFLAFVMLWAYFSFSQFLIIWSGNLPEEATWYVTRLEHGWGWIALALVLFHFALPFVLLLSRDLKRHARLLVGVAVLMLVMRLVDLYWQVEPAFHEGTFAFSWMYLVTPVAIGGLWLWWFLWELKKRPLLPLNDPYLAEAVGHGPSAH